VPLPVPAGATARALREARGYVLVGALEELAAEDRAVHEEARVHFAQTGLATLGILIVVLMVSRGYLPLPGEHVMVGALAGFGVLLVREGLRYHRFRRLNLPDEFRLTLLPVLDTLRDDQVPEGRLHLALDLSGLRPEKQVSEAPSIFRDDEVAFHDPWCVLSGRSALGGEWLLELWNEVDHHSELRGSGNTTTSVLVRTKTAFARVTLGIQAAPETGEVLPVGVQVIEQKGGPALRAEVRGDFRFDVARGAPERCLEGTRVAEALRAVLDAEARLRG